AGSDALVSEGAGPEARGRVAVADRAAVRAARGRRDADRRRIGAGRFRKFAGVDDRIVVAVDESAERDTARARGGAAGAERAAALARRRVRQPECGAAQSGSRVVHADGTARIGRGGRAVAATERDAVVAVGLVVI